MNLNNYFYYFPSALPERICDEIINHGLSYQDQIGITGGQGVSRDVSKNPLNNEEKQNLKKIRDSNVAWLNDNWIYKEIYPYIDEANKSAGWNFDWDSSESCQFTKYKLNQYYDWHCDSQDAPCKDKTKPHLYGKIRKLSVTCQLNDESEYSGGELEFDTRSYMPHDKKIIQCKNISSKGTIIVFPSFVWHRVKPVTSGTRYSLVIWNLGKPYR